MDQHPHDQPHDEVQQSNQQTGNGVALDELRRTIQRTEEGRFLLVALAPFLGGLVIDGTCRHIGVNGELLAGHSVQGKTGTHLGHPGGALGDHHEVNDQKYPKDHQAEEHTAAHDELSKPFDDVTSRIGAGVALTDDQLGGGDVQRQAQHQRGQKNRREGGEIQRPFDEQRDGEDQDRKRK